uniref:C2H2-type domain-containing protein n=1 Tax=Anopheles minimus TaxID=112268 RepID=A0A182W7W1_9DIPT
MFDGFPVVCEYIDTIVSNLPPDPTFCWEPEWSANHVRTSQYFLQVVKCANRKCCSEHRSSYFIVMPEQFFSAPICIQQSKEGLKAQHILQSLICKTCDMYFAPHVLLKEHLKVHANKEEGEKRMNLVEQNSYRLKERMNVENEDAIWEEEAVNNTENNGIPIISIDEQMKPTWRDV